MTSVLVYTGGLQPEERVALEQRIADLLSGVGQVEPSRLPASTLSPLFPEYPTTALTLVIDAIVETVLRTCAPLELRFAGQYRDLLLKVRNQLIA